MMRVTTALAVSLCLWGFLGLPIAGQVRPPTDIRFQRVNSNDGLSQDSSFSMVQDDLGFMWIASQDGLNRYDGRQFKVFRHDPDNPLSVSDNRITVMKKAGPDFIYVGTFSGGLNRLNVRNESFTSFQHNPDDPNSLSSNQIDAIAVDAEGVVWIGTPNGLNRLDPEGNIQVWRKGGDVGGRLPGRVFLRGDGIVIMLHGALHRVRRGATRLSNGSPRCQSHRWPANGQRRGRALDVR